MSDTPPIPPEEEPVVVDPTPVEPDPAPESPVPGSDVPDPTVDPVVDPQPGDPLDPTDGEPEATQPDGTDEQSPDYDPTKDPNSPFYDAERDPNSALYKPYLDPANPDYDATRDPMSPLYDPTKDPDSPLYNPDGTTGTGRTSAAVFRVAYSSSPLDESEDYLTVTRTLAEVPSLRVECGGIQANRLLVAQMSIGLAEPDGGFGHWGFRLCAAEGQEGEPFLVDEAMFPVTGYPFKPTVHFTCPTIVEYDNLVLWVETYLSQGTGNLRVSDVDPTRMHSFLAVLDYGPLN